MSNEVAVEPSCNVCLPGEQRLMMHAVLQVHDEVIMEGPKESAERAQQLVVQHMEHPFNGQNPLSVELLVDSNTADTWYEAK